MIIRSTPARHVLSSAELERERKRRGLKPYARKPEPKGKKLCIDGCGTKVARRGIRCPECSEANRLRRDRENKTRARNGEG